MLSRLLPVVAGLVAVTLTLHGCGGVTTTTTTTPAGTTTAHQTTTVPPTPAGPTTTTTTFFPAGACDCTKCSVPLSRGQCNKCVSDGTSAVTCQGCKSGYTFAADANHPCTFTCGTAPPKPEQPDSATTLNGERWPTMCVAEKEAHFFTVGDWGGVCSWTDNVCPTGHKPMPMDDPNHRPKVKPYDFTAQDLVSQQMGHRGMSSKPFAIMNVGDNFYPGGINGHCGSQKPPTTQQFTQIFEEMYASTSIKDVEWWGVLGNHDYGGVCFVNAWDQQIMYTWGEGTRWTMPAQYWMRTVQFGDFTADFFFLDTNAEDTYPGGGEENHNLCGTKGNTDHSWYCGAQAVGPKPLDGGGASCDVTGPKSLDGADMNCMQWFGKLNDDQFGSAGTVGWLEKQLIKSSAEWFIIVTHFPPRFSKNMGYWQQMSRKYGIDLIIAGHSHFQKVYYLGSAPDQGNYNLQETAWTITGGGGGITSERTPVQGGHDDAYGFMDMKINKDSIYIEAVSHGGIIRNRTTVYPRPRSSWAPHPPSPSPRSEIEV